MDDIREKVRQAYTEAITSVSSGGVDISDMTVGNYSDEDARETGAVSFGCGDPVRAALLKDGERVLDLGSGAGMDLILAAKRVGPGGHVYGLDMTKAMHERARRNLDKLGLRNVTLLRGYIEDIPLHDGEINVLISNCVINLSPDKDKVFAEAFRVLAHGGRFCVSDVVLNKPVPEKLKQSPAAWSGWITGALPSEEYAAKLRRAGFEHVNVTITKPHEINIEVVRSTVNDLTDEDVAAIEGVSSSALITAVKP